MIEGDWYWKIGGVLGFLAGIVTFIACWMYAVGAWGWFLGIAFGWFPSVIIAGIVGALVTLLWGVAALGVAALVLIAVYQS